MLDNNPVGFQTKSIMTGLLTERRRQEFTKNTSQLLPRKTEPGAIYRVRLLKTTPSDAFVNGSNFAHYRDFPFIVQHVHTVWEDVPAPTDEDPDHVRKVPHIIPCPKTDYVKANSTLSKNSCPMCNAWAAAWKAFSDSHFTNQQAKARLRLLGSNMRVMALVYIVQDPNRPENAGSVKVIALDEDCYKELLAQIQAATQSGIPIWNEDACDLYFSWDKVERVTNPGTDKEKRYSKWGFSRIGFAGKVTHCPVTEKMVDDVQFDANWYTVPTKEELEAFYTQWCSQTVSNDDIPMDIPPVRPAVAPAPAPRVAAQKPAPKATPAIVPDPVAAEVTEDADDIPLDPPAPKAAAPAKKAAPAKAAAPAPAPDGVDQAQIDAILKGYLG